LVDGSNVVGSRPDGWWRDRPAAVTRLARHLTRYAEATGDHVTLVFDGPPLALTGCQGIEVRNAPSADDELVELVRVDADPASLTVVTSDRALGDRVRRAGADVLSVRPFRRLIDDAVPAP
jgi:predicted RNA-binding protein with PIN domain